MVIEESNTGAAAAALPQFPPVGPHQATIDNIMSGIENTGAVKMNNHRKKLRQRFDIIKKLGQGTYGKVQLGINKETGQEVAIKTIKKSKIETEADLIRIRREVQIMSSVQHPNIIHIYEVFENREKMVLVMEFAAGGELYDYLSERKVLTEEEARRIFRQVSTAIYYCHKHKICHRDLKLENILLDENGNAKIADFGLSNVFDEQRLLATFCGSPLYASPEIVKGTPYQGPEVDCWSLGVLLYTLVYGAMPFDGANFKRLVKQISAGDYFEPKKPSRASPLIREMLTACPQKRGNIEQICNHWWVNEGYEESCLELAEDLANQTPVRLDVLLSLSPPSVTAEQLVVPNVEDEKKSCDRLVRSHSVGSVMDLQETPGNTEAERRILDMVAAGGEQALMPSQTRIITPSESPVQPKRKLEATVSTENAAGLIKKKERPAEKLKIDQTKSIAEITNAPMDVDPIAGSLTKEQRTSPKIDSTSALEQIGNICDELLQSTTKTATKTKLASPVPAPVTTPSPPEKSPEKPVVEKTVTKKPFNKGKTLDLSATIDKMMKEERELAAGSKTVNERKNSLPEEKLCKPTERRKSKILETAEKFQNMNNQNNEKYKKFVIPGVSVGNFKREFERKASLTSSINLGSPTNEKKPFVDKNKENFDEKTKEKKAITANKIAQSTQGNKAYNEITPVDQKIINKDVEPEMVLKEADSKSSVGSFSLEEARRSMENSIALLNQVKHDDTPLKPTVQAATTATLAKPDVDQLCAKAEKVTAFDDDRERKLKNAREIIGNAIPKGIRKPPLAFGANGRSMSQNVGGLSNERKTMRLQVSADPKDIRTANFSISTPEQKLFNREPFSPTNKSFDQKPFDENTTKTSRAEITLKSATLPRRKTVKSEIQLDIKPKLENPMRFSTEMQHQMPDLRSAPIREHPVPYSPINEQRANSLEPVSKPPTYKNTIQGTRRDILSRQSTNESNDSDNTPSQSQTQISSGSVTAPIKKSPREFIIPIAVEGGGYVTPRATSLEPSESGNTSENLSSFSSKKKLSRPKRMGSLFSEKGSEEDLTSPFQRLNRHTSLGRDSDSEEPRFHTMHRLRSSRPSKRSTSGTQVEKNDSASSGEDDDEDAFEILTAENLFSTLLSRVRALTNRVNESNNEFPSSRLLRDFQQTHSPFWNNDPFNRSETIERKETRNNGIGSNLNASPSAWRHSATRNLGSDFDSMFSRSGATLPRGRKQKPTHPNGNSNSTNEQKSSTKSKHNNTNKNLINDTGDIDVLDLGDLDLSQLRLTKKDLETLSTITPSLSKRLQEQLLAQLPPNQARKLSRTLSMQSSQPQASKEFLRSHSTGGDVNEKRGLNEYSYDRDENRYTSGSVTPTNVSEPLCKFEKDFYNRSNRPSEERSYRAGSHSGINCSASPPPLPPCYYETRCLSPVKDGQTPRNGYVSPPLLPNDVVARRKSLNRRISKFLRPDFYDVPISDPGPNVLEREKFNRECETQKILREIREKSRERSVDRQMAKKNNDEIRHIGRHRSMSRSKETTYNENINLQPIKDKILDELNNLSILQIDALPVNEDTTNKPSTKLKEKVKKVKTKQPKTEVIANDNLDILPKPIKKESKLQRPKSYPIKTTENLSLINNTSEEKKKDVEQLESNNTSKVTRPKSFPHSKITPPKDAKKTIELSQTPDLEKQFKNDEDSQISKPPGSKIAKKTTTKSKITKETTTHEDTGPKIEGSPEKKVNKGFLYSIGQKFEKLRDATKSKDKKSGVEPITTAPQPDATATTKLVSKAEVKKKDSIEAENIEEKAKMDRISKIDAMIRNLRDRSVPRGPEITESGLIKRAVSVEEMPGTFNKCSVNKVLGLFKKIEKDNVDKSKKVLNAKSTSYIGTTNAHSSGHKERPKSSNFSNRHEEFTTLVTTSKLNAIPTKSCQQKSDSPLTDSIEDCEGDENYTNVSKRHSRQSIEKERLKNNRKALLLDFSQITEDKIQNCDSNYMTEQGVDKINNNSNKELNSRQPYHHHHHHLVSNTNNSSMSTSTFDSFNNSFRSPDDEPLSSAFDSSESYLSDDHISPSVSRKSSHHYIHAPSFVPVNDTVNDRIRRMSFYSRYNENKPRRISHIVGPAAKDYYSLDREPSEPAVSNRLASSRHHHEYSRSLTSNIPEPLKTLPHSYYRPMKYPLTNDYSKRRSSNLVVPTSSHVQLSSPITMYTTMNRKIQPYSHRSISMLDSSTSGMNSLTREHTPRATTTDNGLFTRSSVRSRHPSQSPAD